MEYSIKDGVVHLKLLDGEITMTKEQALEQMKLNESAAKFLEKRLELYGNENWSISDTPADADYYARAELQLEELKIQIEKILKEDTDHRDYLSGFNVVISKTIEDLERKIAIPVISNKDVYRYQIEWLRKLLYFTMYSHRAIGAQKRMAAFRACTDFKELIEKFGDEAELMKEYESGLAFTPNKKLFIERRINVLIDANDKIRITHNSWYPTPKNTYTVAFGEYKRIGYAWVIGGYNATWNDLDGATLRNVSINAAVPHEERDQVYAALLFYMIQGGALAFHISFLYNELDKLNATGQNLQVSSIIGIQRSTHKIHFDDFSGELFERLVFAYLNRRPWDSLEWLGQSGADGGRDIWGILNDKSTCFQCANYPRVQFAKIQKDIDKLKTNNTVPDHFVVVCGGKASGSLRKKIITYATAMGINGTKIWSGVEFEEMLRSSAPDLIKRFAEGDQFPEINE